MKFYRVDHGVARFHGGQQLTLEPDQIAPRAHNIELPKGYDGKKQALVAVKPGATVEFIAGEKLGLAELPPSYTGVLVPLGQPQSEEDKIALAKAGQRAADDKAAAQRAAAKAAQ